MNRSVIPIPGSRFMRPPYKMDRVVNLHVPFFSMRDAQGVESGISSLRQESDRPVVVDIRSRGGTIAASRHLRNVFKEFGIIVGRVSGPCFGNAFLVWQSSTLRHATKDAIVRLHHPYRLSRQGVWASDAPEEVKLAAGEKALRALEQAQRELRTLARIYHRRNPHISYEEFLSMMSSNETFGVEKAVALGLVDFAELK